MDTVKLSFFLGDTAMLSFFLGRYWRSYSFFADNFSNTTMFLFKLLRDADLLSFVFGGKASMSSWLFLRFLFRKQKSKQLSSLMLLFFVCANLCCSRKSSHQQKENRKEKMVVSFIAFTLFSSLAFFFWREKKKVYRKNEEKQRYTQKTCLVVEHVPLFIQQTHEEKKTFFLRLGIENKEKKNSAVSKKQQLILKHKKVGKNT